MSYVTSKLKFHYDKMSTDCCQQEFVKNIPQYKCIELSPGNIFVEQIFSIVSWECQISICNVKELNEWVNK